MTLYIKSLGKWILAMAASCLLLSCSSTPTPEPGTPPEKKVAKNSVLEEVTDKDNSLSETAEATQNPKYTELMQLLASLGYEGVGMQFEKEDKLNLLIQVFSNPKAAYRYLRLIYTGTQWGYDLKHQSLTVGDGKDAAQTLLYIEKNIKLKPVSQRKPIVKPTPVPVAPVFPKKLPVDVQQKLQKPVPEPTPLPTGSGVEEMAKPATPTPTPTPVPPPMEEKISEEPVPENTPAPSTEPSPEAVPAATPKATEPLEEQISPFKEDSSAEKDSVPTNPTPEE